MLKFLIVLQLFYALNTGSSINSKHGVDEENKADFIAIPRTSRHADDSKDPYTIVKDKCTEYAKARYITKEFMNEGAKRKLDCVGVIQSDVAERARLKEFPHMALIGYNDQNDDLKDVHWSCSGTLISDRYVMTAAHCHTQNKYVPKWVRLGELIVGNDSDFAKPKDYRIAKLIPHPQYKHPAVINDIMLLELSEPVTFTPSIRPICLYPSEDIVSTFYHHGAVMSGWGRSGPDAQRSDELYKVKVKFTEDSKCTSQYGQDENLPNKFNSSSMICAGDTNGVELCRGECGAPLQIPNPGWQCMYWQVGITSYGPVICGQKGLSTIYTRVSHYIPWIQSIVWP